MALSGEEAPPSEDGGAYEEKPYMLSTARGAAFKQLMRVEADGAYAGLASGKYGSQSNVSGTGKGMTGQESRQVTELVSGVTRWKRWLDFLIMSFYDGNPDGMETTLKVVLRLGLYELFKMRTPSHAVVNEYVDLAKEAVRPQAGRLVNSILRTADRSIKEATVPSVPVQGNARAQARALATMHSHPTWIVRRWLDRYGLEGCEALLRWNNGRPAYGVRANAARGLGAAALLTKLDELGAEASESELMPGEFVLVKSGLQKLMAAGLLEDGQCTVQDESAAMVVALLDPQPGDVLLDACSAPGGKALFAAARMNGTGKVVAMDVSSSRLEAVAAAAARLGVESLVETRALDLRLFPSMLRKRAEAKAGAEGEDFEVGVFDKVLIDAPCSGLGVLGKRADLRWRRSAESLPELTTLQSGLLAAGAELVKPGGVLVYSTCSIEPEENEEQVAAFLAAHPHFEVESAAGRVPAHVVSEGGFLATLPHRDSVDGAFGARLRRVR